MVVMTPGVKALAVSGAGPLDRPNPQIELDWFGVKSGPVCQSHEDPEWGRTPQAVPGATRNTDRPLRPAVGGPAGAEGTHGEVHSASRAPGPPGPMEQSLDLRRNVNMSRSLLMPAGPLWDCRTRRRSASSPSGGELVDLAFQTEAKKLKLTRG